MTLREPWAAVKQRLLSSGKPDFASLVKLAGLDPARHMRFAEWSGVDFGGSDLRGFDFTGARLIGCNFKGALIEDARFDQALIDELRPGVKLDPGRTNLRAAEDWEKYVKGWKQPEKPALEHLPPGSVFQDAPLAPEMVVVPPGRFIMGSKEGEGDPREYPQHEVTIPQAFAVGRFPLTFEEWEAAPVAFGEKPGRRGSRPVISVSWHKAQTYVSWLSGMTGKPYQLLSEAEWEYSCRAATETAYSFGDVITKAQAQFAEKWRGTTYATIEVGSFPANDFGLYDMHGNVWEWCEDLWHDSYADKPDGIKITGGAWTTGDSSRRVLRGGSWSVNAKSLRAAARIRYYPVSQYYNIGFRVARALHP